MTTRNAPQRRSRTLRGLALQGTTNRFDQKTFSTHHLPAYIYNLMIPIVMMCHLMQRGRDISTIRKASIEANEGQLKIVADNLNLLSKLQVLILPVVI